MATVFRDSDADLSVLSSKSIAVLGYGSQGRAQALNLRDSGLSVLIGVRRGKSFEMAVGDGFAPVDLAAAAAADVLVFCLPDTEMASAYRDSVSSRLRTGACLVFAHGFAVHYGVVSPPSEVDVVLVAPMGAGPVVRSRYAQGSGVPGLLAVHQDATGCAWPIAKAYGSAIGCGRVAMLETTFREETESDLFGEQAVLCGGLPELMRAAFRTLVEEGIQPEIAYIACVHEVKLIVDLIFERGLDGMVKNISQTAEWGAYETGPSVIDRLDIQEAWKRIRSGEFARGWLEESRAGASELRRRREEFLNDPIHEAGRRVRELMGLDQETKG